MTDAEHFSTYVDRIKSVRHSKEVKRSIVQSSILFIESTFGKEAERQPSKRCYCKADSPLSAQYPSLTIIHQIQRIELNIDLVEQ